MIRWQPPGRQALGSQAVGLQRFALFWNVVDSEQQKSQKLPLYPREMRALAPARPPSSCSPRRAPCNHGCGREAGGEGRFLRAPHLRVRASASPSSAFRLLEQEARRSVQERQIPGRMCPRDCLFGPLDKWTSWTTLTRLDGFAGAHRIARSSRALSIWKSLRREKWVRRRMTGRFAKNQRFAEQCQTC